MPARPQAFAVITCCPQCQTRFRVAAEQLLARQGLVRCGRCTAVFNGFAGLLGEGNEGAGLLVERNEGAGASASNPNDETGGAGLSGHIAKPAPKLIWAPALPGAGDDAAAPAETSDAADIAAPLVVDGPSPEVELIGAETSAIEPPAAASKAGLDGPPSSLPAPRTEPALLRPDLYECVRPHRAAWITACLVLALALAAQTVYFLRSEIVANWPETKPLLTAICDYLGCQVLLPRHIDQLTLDASELQADPGRPNVVLVTAVLRNRGATAQSYPVLEITLNDTLDRPLARRSLTAADYLPASVQAQEGIPAAGEVIVKTAMETVGMQPSGYRLRLYYP